MEQGPDLPALMPTSSDLIRSTRLSEVLDEGVEAVKVLCAVSTAEVLSFALEFDLRPSLVSAIQVVTVTEVLVRFAFLTRKCFAGWIPAEKDLRAAAV